MEFHINTAHATVNAGLVQEVLWQIDPASVAQLSADGHELRIKVETDANGLLGILQGIDLPINATDMTQVASECCGGCGG